MARRRHQPTEADSEPRLRLVVLAGPGAGRKHLVHGGEVLGRSDEAAIPLDDPKVSREHARIVREPDGALCIEDLKSRNGTTLNGVVVERAPLSIGDRVQLASGVVLIVTRYDPSEQQMLQRQRLEILGRLGAGLAHDLKNVQTVIVAGLDYVEGSPEGTTVEASDVRECLRDVRAASSRATELVTRLLALARSDDDPYRPTDLSNVCQESLRLARVAFGGTITIEHDVAPHLTVIGNGGELHQAFMNLCLNARDAMSHGGRMTVTAKPAGEELSIVFADSGHGMDEETRARVFEPFFTTKLGDGGFGLGLATVRDIITAHGGRIEVESKVGAGTTFRITLPAAPRIERRHKATAAVQRRPTGGSGVILLVDDDTAVRNSFRRILARAGHEVIIAADGVEALQQLAEIRRERPDKPDLVLLDRDMPRMGGDEALIAMRKEHPDLRVVLLTGNRTDEPPQDARPDGVLAKPIGADELLQEIAVALASE